MGADSKITWTHHTFNPWIGCSKVSAGCQHCYAEALMDRQRGKVKWGDKGTRAVTSDANWRQPLAWNRAAEKAGERHRVFCASLADVFENRPELAAPRARLFRLIAVTPHLDWLLLTKRPENVMALWPGTGNESPVMIERGGHRLLANVWLGASVENQEQADKRIPLLLQIPAAVRFVSAEPLLGPTDPKNVCWRHADGGGASAVDVLGGWYPSPWEPFVCPGPKIDWLIIGGESGPHRRDCGIEPLSQLARQAQAAGVPVFFKQVSHRFPGHEDGAPGWLRALKQFPEVPSV